ncbi:hypothetical protein HMPREF3156_01126 [Neisseria sp. HMSC06F02]|nr:hypothetical protein HMPREF3156_01126 [Neisseria sp. HMSC06F02]
MPNSTKCAAASKPCAKNSSSCSKPKAANQDFDFIIEQNGMFSFSGLTPEQVDRLKNEFAIYAVRSGRINVAGITDDNIDYLCESIVKVL